jgi:hypothetical protein
VTIITFPRPGRFEEVLAAAKRQAPAERYILHADLDGYVIRDRGEVACIFRGPQLARASKTLRALQADERTGPEAA